MAVVIDPHGPAGTVHRALVESRRPVPLRDFTAADLVQAHQEFMDGLVEGTVVHRPDREGRLASAPTTATVRLVREQEVLSRLSAGDGSSPAAPIAAELAAYGLAHPVDVVPPPQVVGPGSARPWPGCLMCLYRSGVTSDPATASRKMSGLSPFPVSMSHTGLQRPLTFCASRFACLGW